MNPNAWFVASGIFSPTTKLITRIAVVLLFALPNCKSVDNAPGSKGGEAAHAPVAKNVLLINWGDETDVYDNLVAYGHNVTNVASSEWNGTNPSLDSFDVAILLLGSHYGNNLGGSSSSPGYSALIDFVTAGGTLASTEWFAYARKYTSAHSSIDSLMPFDYTSYGAYAYNASYTLLDYSHALTKNLPSSWAAESSDGGSCVDLVAGATVLMTRNFSPCPDVHALAYINVGSGVSIHINSDFRVESGERASPELLQIAETSLIGAKHRHE
jgi:hypothetical protein